MGIGPLTGVKVIDLTQFESGTVCTETLAWMGAEVWKVERPVKGELGRRSVVKPEVDTYGFAILNMNKKSITCDLKSPAGIQLIYGLLPKADVIVENMGPGSIERLGLGYEKCKEFNDKIIFASIKGFSKTSPYTDYPAFDPIATHTGGPRVPDRDAGDAAESRRQRRRFRVGPDLRHVDLCRAISKECPGARTAHRYRHAGLYHRFVPVKLGTVL